MSVPIKAHSMVFPSSAFHAYHSSTSPWLQYHDTDHALYLLLALSRPATSCLWAHTYQEGEGGLRGAWERAAHSPWAYPPTRHRHLLRFEGCCRYQGRHTTCLPPHLPPPLVGGFARRFSGAFMTDVQAGSTWRSVSITSIFIRRLFCGFLGAWMDLKERRRARANAPRAAVRVLPRRCAISHYRRYDARTRMHVRTLLCL